MEQENGIFKFTQSAFTMADRVAERRPHFGLFACGLRDNALQVSTLTNKLDCHGGQSFARLAMTGRRGFACPDFIMNLLPYCPSALVPLKAFTMAEILISLTIIGVIAAITLPSLVGNINESTWATQRKALYSRMSQSISMLPSLNGYGTYAGSWSADNVSVTDDTAAQAFVTDGLSKVLQINNICTIPANTESGAAREELKKCGIPDKFINMANSKIDFPTKLSELNPVFLYWENQRKDIDTVPAAFVTKNGESVAVFYNPYCNVDNTINDPDRAQPLMCADFIYDLNGKKGPNKAGKDIGVITALFGAEPAVIAPFPTDKELVSYSPSVALVACRKNNDTRVPNRDELISMFINMNIWGIGEYAYFSSTKTNETNVWCLNFGNGRLQSCSTSYASHVRCVKR